MVQEPHEHCQVRAAEYCDVRAAAFDFEPGVGATGTEHVGEDHDVALRELQDGLFQPAGQFADRALDVGERADALDVRYYGAEDVPILVEIQ